jgi:hypothetical protein
MFFTASVFVGGLHVAAAFFVAPLFPTEAIMAKRIKSEEVVKEVLTNVEQAEAQKHEQIVDSGLSGYVSIGAALGTIRDQHLYLGRFSDYTLERFEIPYHQAVRKINAARVALHLQAAGLVVPSIEGQSYELHDLEPEAQTKTWKKVLERAKKDGVRVTTALIKKVRGKKVKAASTAAFTASSGEKPAETASEAVSQPVAAMSNEEKPMETAAKAVGKAVSDLQIALGALENVEVTEAEPLDAMLAEITGLVAAIRERLFASG